MEGTGNDAEGAANSEDSAPSSSESPPQTPADTARGGFTSHGRIDVPPAGISRGGTLTNRLYAIQGGFTSHGPIQAEPVAEPAEEPEAEAENDASDLISRNAAWG